MRIYEYNMIMYIYIYLNINFLLGYNYLVMCCIIQFIIVYIIYMKRICVNLIHK